MASGQGFLICPSVFPNHLKVQLLSCKSTVLLQNELCAKQMPASTFSLQSSMCCDVRLREEIKHALPRRGWAAASSVSRNELNLFAGQRKAPADAVSTAPHLYELFKHSVRSGRICCYLLSCSNTHPCSHGYGKDCETSTGSNTNTTKIYGRIHGRGELWEQPFFMCLQLHQCGSAGHVLSVSQRTRTCSQRCRLLCDPRKTRIHSPAIIQRHSTCPRAESALFIPHEPLTSFQMAEIFYLFIFDGIAWGVLLNPNVALAVSNNVSYQPAWARIKSAPAFSMKFALDTLAAIDKPDIKNVPIFPVPQLLERVTCKVNLIRRAPTSGSLIAVQIQSWLWAEGINIPDYSG